MSNEIKYQSLFGSKWDDCSKIVYDSLPDSQRRIAPINVSVQEEKEKEDVLAFKFMMGNAFSKYESKHGNYDDLKNDLIRAFNKAKDIPSPAATEPTTNAGIDKGEGIEQFEYRLEQLTPREKKQEIEHLNDIGKQGWELVNVDREFDKYYFKRKKP